MSSHALTTHGYSFTLFYGKPTERRQTSDMDEKQEQNVPMERLRRELHIRKIPQSRFAELTGISQCHLSRMLSGEVNCSDAYLERAAAALEISKEYLMGKTDDPHIKNRKSTPVLSAWKQAHEIRAYLISLEGRGITVKLPEERVDAFARAYPGNREETVSVRWGPKEAYQVTVQEFMKSVHTFSAVADQLIPLLLTAGLQQKQSRKEREKQ